MFSISGVQAAAIAYLGEFHSNKTRAKHVTFAAMFMTIAIVYQPLMGLFIMPRQWQFSLFGIMLIRPWRMYILISSCTSALAFVAISLLPESPKFELVMGRKEEALAILRRVYAANGLGSKEVSNAIIKIKVETALRLSDLVSLLIMCAVYVYRLYRTHFIGLVN